MFSSSHSRLKAMLTRFSNSANAWSQKELKRHLQQPLSFSKSVTFDKNNHLINLETFSDGFDDNGPYEIVPPEV
ncbi:hypothetical protein Hanom_Chr08g00718531 [Helianthus anomalus]